MTRVIKLHSKNPPKFGFKRARLRKRVDLEEFGQLNMFDQSQKETKVIRFNAHLTPFEEALLMDEQDEVAARMAYWKAIKSGDCVADAYCNLGILESNCGETVKAIDDFSNSLKHNPRHFEAHYNLANLYSDLGDLALARLHYELALEIDPEFSNAHYNLGLVLLLSEDYEAALKVLNSYRGLVTEEEGNQAVGLIEKIKNSLNRSL